MALDYFAIASYGVYPTPTPTGARRAALAVSMGLLNIDLPVGAATQRFFTVARRFFRRTSFQWDA